MNNRVCYLGGPVDYAQDNGAGWREEIIQYAADNNTKLSFFNPPAAYSFTEPSEDIAHFLFNLNMVALRGCGVAYFRWSKQCVSIGTPIEIYEAYQHAIPMLIVTDMGDSLTLLHLTTGKDVLGGFQLQQAREVMIKSLDTSNREILDILVGMATQY